MIQFLDQTGIKLTGYSPFGNPGRPWKGTAKGKDSSKIYPDQIFARNRLETDTKYFKMVQITKSHHCWIIQKSKRLPRNMEKQRVMFCCDSKFNEVLLF